jgi:DNA-binding NarL/FixJ family response regulator
MNFLIVEDNNTFRAEIRSYLLHTFGRKTSVAECSDGGDAVEYLRSQRADWILMDIELPTMDGLEATRRITASSPSSKIIMLTQYDEEAYREAAKDAGARGYVLKEQLASLDAIIKRQE